MYERKNEYLRKRFERVGSRDGARRMMDGRNPYGSAGGYVSSSRPRDNGSYDMGYGADYRTTNSYDGVYNQRTAPSSYSNNAYDYRHNDYARNDYDYADADEKYHKKLKKLIERLEKNDRLSIPRSQIIKRAKEMGIMMNELDEEEFYAAYLIVSSMFKDVTNDYSVYIKMTKQFLYNDLEELDGADKLCAYYIEIIKGGDIDL